MKVLLISENQEKSSLLISALKESGMDYIHYRWFLKALDNIEEIQPDMVVINCDDYPRHWKILSQFVKCPIFSEPAGIILYSASGFTEDDMEKARVLKVLDTVCAEDINKIKESFMEYSNYKTSISLSPCDSASINDENSISYILKTVDTLLDESDFLATVDNLLEYGSFVSVKPSEEKEIINEEYENKSDYDEEEVPTVSGIFQSNNAELPVSGENDPDIFNITEEDIQNENTLYTVDNLFGLEENDYSITTVDNLFYEEEECIKNIPENQGQCKQMVGSLLHRIMEYYEQ